MLKQEETPNMLNLPVTWHPVYITEEEVQRLTGEAAERWRGKYESLISALQNITHHIPSRYKPKGELDLLKIVECAIKRMSLDLGEIND